MFFLLTIFLGMIAVGQLILIVAMFRHFRHNEPPTTQANKELKRAENKSQNILYQAFKKAKNILGAAELEGIKQSSQAKLHMEKFEKDYEAKLTESIDNHLTQSLSLFDKRLNAAVSKIENDSLAAVANFEKSQVDRINSNLVAVVEGTIARVLKKKLTVSDQLDSVYEAFNQARAEKFL